MRPHLPVLPDHRNPERHQPCPLRGLNRSRTASSTGRPRRAATIWTSACSWGRSSTTISRRSRACRDCARGAAAGSRFVNLGGLRIRQRRRSHRLAGGAKVVRHHRLPHLARRLRRNPRPLERPARRLRLPDQQFCNMGGERSMVRHERLFLTQNTLPVFDRLLDTLDQHPGRGPQSLCHTVLLCRTCHAL